MPGGVLRCQVLWREIPLDYSGEFSCEMWCSGSYVVRDWSLLGCDQWRTQEFFSGVGGVQQIQLRTEDREDGDLGAVAP